MIKTYQGTDKQQRDYSGPKHPPNRAAAEATSKSSRQKKTHVIQRGFWAKALAVTYFRMGKPHTIIGDASFHF